MHPNLRHLPCLRSGYMHRRAYPATVYWLLQNHSHKEWVRCKICSRKTPIYVSSYVTVSEWNCSKICSFSNKKSDQRLCIGSFSQGFLPCYGLSFICWFKALLPSQQLRVHWTLWNYSYLYGTSSNSSFAAIAPGTNLKETNFSDHLLWWMDFSEQPGMDFNPQLLKQGWIELVWLNNTRTLGKGYKEGMIRTFRLSFWVTDKMRTNCDPISAEPTLKIYLIIDLNNPATFLSTLKSYTASMFKLSQEQNYHYEIPKRHKPKRSESFKFKKIYITRTSKYVSSSLHDVVSSKIELKQPIGSTLIFKMATWDSILTYELN